MHLFGFQSAMSSVHRHQSSFPASKCSSSSSAVGTFGHNGSMEDPAGSGSSDESLEGIWG